MDNEADPIAGIQAHIRDLEKEIVLMKQTANRLSIRRGQQPIYSEADFETDGASIGSLRTDQFFGKAIATSIREYLGMRRVSNLGPATVHEIHNALATGGYKFETDDVENRKRNLRISLTKNTAIFHRMPDGTHFGLKEWYPGVKDEAELPKTKKKGKRKGQKAKVPESAEPSPAASTKTVGAAKPTTGEKPVTVLEAVRLALLAKSGEFTKQDILDWIVSNHPALKAEERKQSVFTTVNKFKDEMGIETVKVGKGAEPYIFKKKKD